MVDTESLFQGEWIDGEVCFALGCTLKRNVSHWHLHLGFPSVDGISLLFNQQEIRIFPFVVEEPFGRALTSGIVTAKDLVKHCLPALLGAISLVW